MTVRQVGADVVVQASGSANTNPPDYEDAPGRVGGEVDPNPLGVIYVSGTVSGKLYRPQNFSGPTSIGAGVNQVTLTGSGDRVGIWWGQSGFLVPSGYVYVSGQSLSGTATYSSTTISALGMTPGTYTWTWGSGGNADSFVLTIESPSPAAVPTLSEWAQILLGLMVLTMLVWHFYRERSY